MSSYPYCLWRRSYTEGDRVDYIEFSYEVSIRKHQVDIKGLQNLLRAKKSELGLTNKQIAEALCLPLTNVEHWFRTDKYFSIPEPSIWSDLKILLQINSTEYDAQIMEFIVQPGVFEKSGRLYPQNGIAPTITAADEVKVIAWTE